MAIPIEVIEKELLRQVKFIDIILGEISERNEKLREHLGNSYAKYVGLSAPYDQAVKELRAIKKNFDSYLKVAREHMASEYRKRFSKDYSLTEAESKRGKRNRAFQDR